MFNRQTIRLHVIAMSALVGLGGCTTTSPDGAFDEVAQTVGKRSGKRVAWNRDAQEIAPTKAEIRKLLSRTLTASSAVQIALLNNRRLQATYAELGIAQADLAQATRLPNPIVDGSITFTDDGVTNLAFGGALKVIEILYIPLKKRVAASQLEEVKLRVATQVLGVASETHLAFIDYQSSQQLVALFDDVLSSTRASMAAAKSLREAGNITALEFETQNGELVREKLSLAKSEARSTAAREALNVLMGLTGSQTRWTAAGRLPAIPSRKVPTHRSERRAIEASLELAASRQRLITLAKSYRLKRAESLVPDLEVGSEWERDDGEEEAGPIFEIQLPLFDWGRPRKAKAMMELARARDTYTALAVRVRSAARLTKASLLTARKTALFYQKSVLPQSRRLLTETQRQVNAMQESVFQLIQAKQRQIRTSQESVQALADYWRARVRFSVLMRGKLPANQTGGAVQMAAASNQADSGGH